MRHHLPPPADHHKPLSVKMLTLLACTVLALGAAQTQEAAAFWLTDLGLAAMPMPIQIGNLPPMAPIKLDPQAAPGRQQKQQQEPVQFAPAPVGVISEPASDSSNQIAKNETWVRVGGTKQQDQVSCATLV